MFYGKRGWRSKNLGVLVFRRVPRFPRLHENFTDFTGKLLTFAATTNERKRPKFYVSGAWHVKNWNFYMKRYILSSTWRQGTATGSFLRIGFFSSVFYPSRSLYPLERNENWHVFNSQTLRFFWKLVDRILFDLTDLILILFEIVIFNCKCLGK